MLKIFFLSVCLVVVIAHDGKSRIVGGTNVGELVGRKVVNTGEFPFMAQIKLKENGSKNLFHCTASIIESDVLLTAAHCLDGRSPEDFIIFAGNVRKLRPKNRTQKRRVQNFVIHENFTNTSPNNDIGLIFLTTSFKTTKFVSPIKGPNTDDYEVGSKVTAIGWGMNEKGDNPQWLKKTDLFLISNNECQNFLSRDPNFMLQITDDMVCAINQDISATCRGDSGGPLIYNNRLIGTNSFSSSTLDPGTGKLRCDTSSPTGFVRLSNYYDWIEKTLEANPSIDT